MITLLNHFLDKTNSFLWGSFLIFVLVGLGLYFTIVTRAVQIRLIFNAIKLLAQSNEKTDKKVISGFQAFAISISSRVGTGNLAGIALAVAIGGPGAVFWMWVVAIVGSASAFIESALAQIYKKPDGHSFKGGPAYYIETALGQRWLGIVFAVLTAIAFGLVFSTIQINSITQAFDFAFNINPAITSLVLAILTAVVIFGGRDSVAKVSSIFVPVLAVSYLLTSWVIIALNIEQLPLVFKLIFTEAFKPSAAITGGLIGTIQQGVRRGLFSNEAGMGSAPNAAAAAHTAHPVTQGLIQSLAVLIDTLVICTTSALIVLVANPTVGGSPATGIMLTQESFRHYIGSAGPIFVAVLIFILAFTTVISCYYYGETNIKFINDKNKYLLPLFRVGVVVMVFVGGISSLETVWNLGDFFMAIITLINLISIFLLTPIVVKALKDYEKKLKSKQAMSFKASDIGLKNLEGWAD